jgi:hypothetical protein
MDLQDQYISFAISTEDRYWSHQTDTIEELCRDTNGFTYSVDYLGDDEWNTYNFSKKHNYILYGLTKNNEWEILLRVFHHSRLKDKRTILKQIEDIFGMIDKYDSDDGYSICYD